MYVCGITPYDTTHLGHAFTYIFFDVLLRYLKYKKYTVTYTQNVTDINDRDKDILQKAKEQNTSWNKLADFWTDKFLTDMKSLNWIMPDNYLKASENIDSMIKIIKQILDKEYAYILNGSVYLDIKKVKDYGRLSRLSSAEMLTKAKEFEEDLDNPDKRNRLDITLWRATEKNQPFHIPSFKSPFGPGRPGWHIECSAMAISSLSEQIDIHGGGADLIFPHHESEIAQSEAASGKIPFAKYWIHNGTVNYQGKKMSKSLGNLVLISDLLKKYSPNAIRYVLLSHHYRSSWEFKEEELGIAEKKVTSAISGSPGKIGATPESDFENLMDDNMNIPSVLSLLPNVNIQQRKNIMETLGFDL